MSKEKSSLGRRFRSGLTHAFALESPYGSLSSDDRALLRRIAHAVNRRGMCGPAILFLASLGPLNYLGSQALVFLRPFLTLIISAKEYEQFARILEHRQGLSALIEEIEAAASTHPSGGDT